MCNTFIKISLACAMLCTAVNIDAQTDSLQIKIGEKLIAISKTYTDI